jgi:hypothetical protein
VLYDESMRDAGVTISHILDHAIQGPDDYDKVAYVFEHARVVPNGEGFSDFQRTIGDRGLAVAFLSLAASPMHLLQRELMAMDQFFYETYDHPERLERCGERIAPYFAQMIETAARCPAEVFLLGANYDAGLTPPRFFRSHILPWLRRAADRVHRDGKYLLTHTDGENTGLLDLYLESGIDIADSVCPEPMTRLTLRQVRETFGGKVTIMGGIPSVALLKETMPDSHFGRFLDRFFEELGAGERIILGISDTTPPDADINRLRKIGERVEAFGRVPRP